MDRSSKCLVFRVARVAREASTIPAIMVSRNSPGTAVLLSNRHQIGCVLRSQRVESSDATFNFFREHALE